MSSSQNKCSAYEVVQPTWQRLPLHPPPQPLESQTSYFLRVAEANGLQTVGDLGRLANNTYLFRLMQAHPDLVHLHMPEFSSLTGCTSEDLDALTLFSIGRHLVRTRSLTRARSRMSVERFLEGSLALHLGYCPVCLAEQKRPYYLLLWRFLSLAGCPVHKIQLLDQCGHCGRRLTYVEEIPKIGVCSSCHKDLRTCLAPKLREDEVVQVGRKYDDLAFLLGNTPTALDEDVEKYLRGENWSTGLAYCYADLRTRRGLTLQGVATHLGIDPLTLLAIETPGISQRATLQACLAYADLLETSFSGLVYASASRRYQTSTETSENRLLAQVDKVMVEMLRQSFRSPIRGLPQNLPGAGRIAEAVGVKVRSLKHYPRINGRLTAWRQLGDRIKAAKNHERERELVWLVKSVIGQLERQHIEPDQSAIARLAGVSSQTLRNYPDVEALLIPIACQRGGIRRSYLVAVLRRLPSF